MASAPELTGDAGWGSESELSLGRSPSAARARIARDAKGPVRAFWRIFVLGSVFALGFVCAASWYRVPAYVELMAELRAAPAVRSVFANRAVKRVYYFLKPRLGLGWEGAFSRARKTGADGLTGVQHKEAEALLALGYADGVAPAGDLSGTTFWSRKGAHPGLNLATDGYEAQAVLMDMEGTVLHSWQLPFSEALPDSDSFEGASGTYNWRRVKPLPDGGLLAIYEGHGLVRIDRDSRRIWGYPEHAHHDVEVDQKGNVWTLIHEAELIPRLHRDKPVLHDFVVRLGLDDGVEKQRISLLEAIERSDYATLLDAERRPSGDIMHTNEIQILDGRLADRIPAFAAGNLLLTVRNLGAVVVLDPEQQKVVWALKGLWKMQHDANVLANGNLLVFDNQGAGGRSRVIEVDPLTQEIVWSYSAEGFQSDTCGTAQRLPNGNTLITESNFGRAFEVAPDGTIVWEYYVPDRTGRDDEFIAQLFELVRIDPATVTWLDEEDASVIAAIAPTDH